MVRAERETALARVRERDGTVEVSGAEVMWDQFADLGELEPHVAFGEGDPVEVVARCRAALADGGLTLEAETWVGDRWPVSMKGVVGWDGRVAVLRNRRGEWELPGGRLDATDASPEAALQRQKRSTCWQPRGCRRVWVNGSFVTAKDEPGDFDACWDTDGVDLDIVDTVLLDLTAHRRAQKECFGGELFPNVIETQSGLSFAVFFQNERDTGRKGIVVIHIGKGDTP